jgi:hypothetical protein
MLVSAVLTAVCAAVAWATIRTTAPVRPVRRAESMSACGDPALGVDVAAGE